MKRIAIIVVYLNLLGCWATDPTPDIEAFKKKQQSPAASPSSISSLNCKSGGYTGPNTQAGIQRDSQCLAVYAYLCAGVAKTNVAIVEACKNYALLNPPGGPKCPYCN